MMISKILKSLKREKSLEEQMKEVRQMLNRNYGKSRFFTISQIDIAIDACSILNSEYKQFIRAYFLSENDFNEVKDAEGIDLDYAEIQAEMSEALPEISTGTEGFDSGGFDGGGGDSGSSGD